MTFRRKLNDGGDVAELHSATEFAQVNHEHQPRDRPVPVGAEAGQQGSALGAVQPTGSRRGSRTRSPTAASAAR